MSEQIITICLCHYEIQDTLNGSTITQHIDERIRILVRWNIGD